LAKWRSLAGTFALAAISLVVGIGGAAAIVIWTSTVLQGRQMIVWIE
jgi:hypothetical protein